MSSQATAAPSSVSDRPSTLRRLLRCVFAGAPALRAFVHHALLVHGAGDVGRSLTFGARILREVVSPLPRAMHSASLPRSGYHSVCSSAPAPLDQERVPSASTARYPPHGSVHIPRTSLLSDCKAARIRSNPPRTRTPRSAPSWRARNRRSVPQSVLRPDAECGELVGNYCGIFVTVSAYRLASADRSGDGTRARRRDFSADSYNLNLMRGAAD